MDSRPDVERKNRERQELLRSLHEEKNSKPLRSYQSALAKRTAQRPAFVGLANWQVPLMVGAPDMALPRLNNWSFWILPFAFAMLISTLFMPGGAPASGWTIYPPLSMQTGAAFPFLIFSIHFLFQ